MASEKQGSENKRDKQTAAKKRTIKLAAPQAQQAATPELVQLALTDPAAVAPSVILALQRSHGNQTVQRLIAQSQAAKEAEAVAEPVDHVKEAVHTVMRRPKLSIPTQTESAAVVPEVIEMESLSAVWQEVEDYVPPIAPPALPPDDKGDPRYKIGSPFRHLDGLSNRKAANKHKLGPASDCTDYVQKNALACKFVAEATDASGATSPVL